MSSYAWPGGSGTGSGVQSYANQAALPLTANDGAAAITQDTDTLWIYNAGSSTWKPVASPVTEAAVVAATSANTASTLVERDASGNFAAGTITAALTGNVTGNVSGSAASFTGSLAGDVTGTQGATSVATVGGSTAANVHSAEQAANAATNLNTASTIVKRDASGNFSAGTITASLTGHASLDVPLTSVGAASGVASLDSGGKVPVAQLPSTTMLYQGAWNASTNTPTLADGTGVNGDVYRASVAGTQNLGSGSQTWAVGDLVIYNGTIWQHCPAADGVSSVNGNTGAVTVNAINQLTGDVTTSAASGSQSEAATVAQVGGVTAANVASGANAANAATSANTASTLVARDGSGNFSAGTITAALSGNATSATSASNAANGEKSYTWASASNNSGWAVTTSGTAVVATSTDTNAADLPRANTTGSGILFTPTAGTGTAYAYLRFTLDAADYNTKLKVQFAQNVLNSYADSDFSIEVHSNTASDYSGTDTRLPLSTDSSSVTGLPALEGTFLTRFDAPGSAAKYLELRVIPKNSVTSKLVISDLIVGPGVVTQGAAVSGEIAYTPSVPTATGLQAGYPKGKYVRVGSNMHVWIGLALSQIARSSGGTLTFSIPSGLTIDASKPMFASGTGASVGTAYVYGIPTASAFADAYSVVTNDSTTLVVLKAGASAVLANTDFNNITGEIGIYADIPIAEWAGSGTVNVAQNDVEYAASTTGTWDASSVAGNTVYGPAGAPITGPLTATRTKVVQFQTPIQQTDSVVLEYQSTAGGPWIKASDSGAPYFATNTAFQFGATISALTGTTATVTFYQWAVAGSVYDSSTGAANWSAALPGPAWRLRKVAGGQAVGFGIVQGNSAGLMPATNTNLDDASATRLGLKQYVAGTTYTNGTLSITSGQAGFAVVRGVLVPYQTNDGTWRLKFNVATSFTSASVASIAVTLSGVTFKNVNNYVQPVTAMPGGSSSVAVSLAYASPNAGTITIQTTTSVSINGVHFSGDVELDSKPTWAY